MLAPLPASVVPGLTPATIPQYQELSNPTRRVASYQPGGRTVTADNAFFASLGTNGRTCFSCHQPQDGWTLTPETVRAVFLPRTGRSALRGGRRLGLPGSPGRPRTPSAARGASARSGAPALRRRAPAALQPRPISASSCPSRRRARRPRSGSCGWSRPLRLRGEREVRAPDGFLSVYRRCSPRRTPSPSTREGVQPVGIFPEGFNIMWDAREPDLASAVHRRDDIHAQSLPGTQTTSGAHAAGRRLPGWALHRADVRRRRAGA